MSGDGVPIPLLPVLLIVGYPLVTVALFELGRQLGRTVPVAGRVLVQAVTVLMPSGAIWLILTELVGLPSTSLVVRGALTVLALSALAIALRLGQTALLAATARGDRSPKLLFDVLRTGMALLWGAVVVSAVWHVNLASVFAALGVGSIVLGFALQDVIGNFISGLALLSDGKFEIGDWIVVDGRTAQVAELDWRSVTLVTGGGERIIMANGTLSKTSVTILARRDERSWAEIPLELGLDIPPEDVRAAVLEAGAAMTTLATDGVSVGGAADSDTVRCTVSGYGATTVRYGVSVRLRTPAGLGKPRDEFLSRFWYVAQRRGLPLGIPAAPQVLGGPDEEARRRLLLETGLFGGDPALLAGFASTARHQHWRKGEVLHAAGGVAETVLVVLSGAVRADAPDGRQLDRIERGHAFVLHETLRGVASPVTLTADVDTQVLTIPASMLAQALVQRPAETRTVTALLQAWQQALGHCPDPMPHPAFRDVTPP